MAKPFDYSQFKTHFVEIEIAPSTNGPFVKLPYQIGKLLQKVEIVEAAGANEGCLQTTANIVFSTSSREPYLALNTADTRDLYPLGTNSNDSLTNAVSMLTDLKFSFQGKSVGFTSLISEGVAALTSAASSVAAGIADITGETSEKIEYTKAQGKTQGGYLFEEGNAVRIKWGYKELPSELRTAMFVIKMVQMDYPESDQSFLTLTCQGPFAEAEKISPTKSQNYYNKIPGGFDPVAGVTFRFKAMSTQQVIQKICNDAGMEFIMSNKLTASIPEDDTFITWPKGMTLIEFLSDLAGRHDAVLNIIYHSKTGKPNVVFVSRTDFYGTTILPKEFFHFKRNGSLLKSISVRADFGAQTGAGLVGMNDKGEILGHVSEVSESVHLAAPVDGSLVDTTASTKKQKEFNQLATGVSGGVVVSKMGYTAEVDKTENLKNLSSSAAACPLKKVIALEFNSIGHPYLRPGAIRINGIGRRYSGLYRIVANTHTLDNSGYTCRATCTGYTMGEGGVTADTTAVKEPTKDTNETIQLADPQAAVAAASQVLTAFTDIEPPFTGTDSAVFNKYNNLIIGDSSDEGLV